MPVRSEICAFQPFDGERGFVLEAESAFSGGDDFLGGQVEADAAARGFEGEP